MTTGVVAQHDHKVTLWRNQKILVIKTFARLLHSSGVKISKVEINMMKNDGEISRFGQKDGLEICAMFFQETTRNASCFCDFISYKQLVTFFQRGK